MADLITLKDCPAIDLIINPIGIPGGFKLRQAASQPGKRGVEWNQISQDCGRGITWWIDCHEHENHMVGLRSQVCLYLLKFCQRQWAFIRAVSISKKEEDYLAFILRQLESLVVRVF